MPAYSMFLTEDCNLGCGYCALSAKQPGRITLEQGRKSIDWILSRGDAKVELCFFGAEPLLEKTKLRELVSHACARVDELQARAAMGEAVVVPALELSMTTNGTLLDGSLIDFLEAHAVQLTLSLDGTAEWHDAWRVTKRGKGTYAIIEKFFARLVSYKPLVTIAMTITPESVDAFSANLKHVHALGFRKIDFSITRDDPAWTTAHFEAWSREIREVARFYVERLGAGDADLRMQTLDAILEEHSDHTDGNCGMGSSILAISTGGELYPCWKFEGWNDARVGNVDEGVDPARARAFTEFHNAQVLACERCPYARHCNRCAWLNLTETGDMTRRARNGCREKMATIPAALEALHALRQVHTPVFEARLEALALDALHNDEDDGFVVFKRDGKVFRVPVEVMAGFLKASNPGGPQPRAERARTSSRESKASHRADAAIAVPHREIVPGGRVPLARLSARFG